MSINIRYGHRSWVLITGGAGGLGKAHAEILANEWKFNLVIVDKDDAGLKRLKKELGSTVSVHTIKADLSSADFKVAQKIWAEATADNRDISIVMNNVGINNYELFHEMSAKML
jgi:short-subunit dehydrogenase